jgi:hypothetical protein
MQHVQDLLRQLANFDAGDALVLSVYLDMRPHGDSPAIRPSLIMLTDRFRQIEKTLLPRGPHWTIFASMQTACSTIWMSMQDHGSRVSPCSPATAINCSR